MDMHRQREQTVPLDHLTHCLSLLRDDIICHGDDTPDGEAFAREPMKLPRYRQCKDWKQLELWASEHTACYSLQNSSYKDAGGLERFKYCPEGSPYIALVKETFGDSTHSK